MAVNTSLMPSMAGSVPVPFYNEMFVLNRQGIVFEVDKIPDAPRGALSTKGSIFLTNVRMVFVADKPVGNFIAFDMPLLYIHEEKFNQPIFYANNITGKVHPVIPDGEQRALYSPYSFKIIFKEGGCGTFVPMFLNLLKDTQQYQYQMNPPPQFQQTVPQSNGHVYSDPIPASPPPHEEIIRQAYVDPNDPTTIYLQQPFDSNQPRLRRRNYTSLPTEGGQL